MLGFALLLMSASLVAVTTPISAAAPAQQLSLSPASLSLSTIPEKLPADSGTYAAIVVSVVDKTGLPTVATGKIQVFLTSSQENVGGVTSTVLISTGQTYAIANFTTTNTPGKTTITATTPGLVSSSTDVTTVVAVGYPTHLVISAVPAIVPARAANTGKLILELEDALGLPAKSIADSQVSVYSSNTNVVNVPEPATVIGQGEYLLEMNYSSGFVPGVATVTASVAGFDSGIATITVLGSPPLALKLFAQPSNMVTCTAGVTSCTGRLIVALTDTTGNPTRAASDIQVQIRSSDLAVVNTVETTVIRAGNISATAAYNVTENAGKTTMTASAPGLQSGFVSITTSSPTTISPSSCMAGTNPKSLETVCQLSLYAGPNPVLADHRSYSSVVVSLQNTTGAPAVNMTGPTRIALTSSVTGVGNFSRVVFSIPKGQNWAAITFTSTFQIGITKLTASSGNFLSVQSDLGTFGPVPSQVILNTVTSSLPADGGRHPALELSLEDALGAPAIAPFDLSVNLSSSRDSIVKVSQAIIPAGQSYALVNVTTGLLEGTANVTAIESAFTTGYTTSSVLLTAVIPAPSSLAAFAPDTNRIMSVTGDQLPLVAIQLQDAAGNPARARVPMNLTIISSNSTVLQEVLSASVDVGQDYALLAVPPVVPGSTTLTISTPGLSVTSLALKFLRFPGQVTITGGPARIIMGQSAAISVHVVLDGIGSPRVPVIWNASSGGVTITTLHSNSSYVAPNSSPSNQTSTSTTSRAAVNLPIGAPSANDTTDKAGASTVLFRPSKTGTVLIVAAVSRNGFPTKTLNFTVQVQPAPATSAKAKPSLTQEFTTFPMVLIPVGGAGGAAAAIFLIRRRGRGGAGADEQFDESLQ